MDKSDPESTDNNPLEAHADFYNLDYRNNQEQISTSEREKRIEKIKELIKKYRELEQLPLEKFENGGGYELFHCLDELISELKELNEIDKQYIKKLEDYIKPYKDEFYSLFPYSKEKSGINRDLMKKWNYLEELLNKKATKIELTENQEAKKQIYHQSLAKMYIVIDGILDTLNKHYDFEQEEEQKEKQEDVTVLKVVSNRPPWYIRAVNTVLHYLGIGIKKRNDDFIEGDYRELDNPEISTKDEKAEQETPDAFKKVEVPILPDNNIYTTGNREETSDISAITITEEANIMNFYLNKKFKYTTFFNDLDEKFKKYKKETGKIGDLKYVLLHDDEFSFVEIYTDRGCYTIEKTKQKEGSEKAWNKIVYRSHCGTDLVNEIDMLDVFMPINPKDKRYTVLYEGHTKDPKKPFFRRIDLFFPYNVYKYMYRMRPLEEKRYNSKEDFLNDEEIIERNAIPDFFISAIKSGIIGVIPEDILLVLREYSPDLANIIESRERNYNDDSGPGGDNR